MTNLLPRLTNKRILLRGPVLTQSGYGVHTRQIARWLLSRSSNVKFQPTPWGITPQYLDRTKLNGLIGEIMDRTSPTHLPVDISFQVQLPNEWDPRLAEFNVGVTALVETDRCNPQWVECCNKMNLIIVPSKFTEQVLKSSGYCSTPIAVVPEAFTDVFGEDDITPLEIELNDFTFVVFGQLTGNNPMNDRKNTFFALKWLCEAFENDKDVGIVIKTNNGRNSLIDRKITVNTFKQMADALPKMRPNITILHGDLEDEEIAGLYRHKNVKALVSLTRGEGYGLPLLEASVAGLPVMATNWSAHTEFLSVGKWLPVDYKLEQIHSSRVDNNIFLKDARWAEASEADFKRKLKKFKESPSIPQEWAVELSSKLKNKLSFDAVAKHYDELMARVIR